MSAVINMKEGDRLPLVRATLKDGNGAVDLTGATVKFLMSASDGTLKVDAAATIIDAATGVVEYAWASADTDAAGDYLAEFEVTFSGGKVETFPNDAEILVRIRKDRN